MNHTYSVEITEDPDPEDVTDILEAITIPDDLEAFEIRVEAGSRIPVATDEGEGEHASDSPVQVAGDKAVSESESSEDVDDGAVSILTDSAYATVLSLVEEFNEHEDSAPTVSNIQEFADDAGVEIPQSTIATYLPDLTERGALTRSGSPYEYELTKLGDELREKLDETEEQDVRVTATPN